MDTVVVQPIVYVLLSFSVIIFATLKKKFFGLKDYLGEKQKEIAASVEMAQKSYQNAKIALKEELQREQSKQDEINVIKQAWENRLKILLEDLEAKEKKQLQFKDLHYEKRILSLEEDFSKKLNISVSEAVFHQLQEAICHINDKVNQNLTSQASKKILTSDCSLLENLFNYD